MPQDDTILGIWDAEPPPGDIVEGPWQGPFGPEEPDPNAWRKNKNAKPRDVPGHSWEWDDGTGQWELRILADAPPGGRTPEDDQREGRRGGYYDDNGVWISGELYPRGGTGGGGGPAAFDYSGLRSSPFGSFGSAPAFNAPTFTGPPAFRFTKGDFVSPTSETLQQDPSFQFRLDQGRKALEQSAAGKGLLRTGGTLKDLVQYGQNFASNEYSNVYNRKFNEYQFDYDREADIYKTNYGVTRDVFDRQYQGAKDMYAPQLAEWQTRANAAQRAAELQFQREWDEMEFNYRREQDQYKNLQPLINPPG